MLFIIRRSFSLVDFFAKKWNTVRLIGNPLFIIMKKRGNTIEDKENNNRMDRLNLSDNIIRFRRERKITQEELADFLGVSKAAVSKWLFEKCVDGLLRAEKVVLHGDEYFDRFDAWIEALPLGEMAPRSRKFVVQNLQEAFSHPAFEALKENTDFQKILQHFAKADT